LARLLQDQVTPSGAEFFGDFARARQVGGEGVVVEEKLAHLGEKFFGVGHFRGHVFRRAHAVFVAADGLGPEAEGALRRAAAAGVEAQIGMEQVADEILFDLQVAFVGVHHPGQVSMSAIISRSLLWMILPSAFR
jgi:hypothetical protein